MLDRQFFFFFSFFPDITRNRKTALGSQVGMVEAPERGPGVTSSAASPRPTSCIATTCQIRLFWWRANGMRRRLYVSSHNRSAAATAGGRDRGGSRAEYLCGQNVAVGGLTRTGACFDSARTGTVSCDDGIRGND